MTDLLDLLCDDNLDKQSSPATGVLDQVRRDYPDNRHAQEIINAGTHRRGVPHRKRITAINQDLRAQGINATVDARCRADGMTNMIAVHMSLSASKDVTRWQTVARVVQGYLHAKDLPAIITFQHNIVVPVAMASMTDEELAQHELRVAAVTVPAAAAAEFIDHGITLPPDIKEWHSEGFSAADAVSWQKIGLRGRSAKKWRSDGCTPDEAQQWLDVDARAFDSGWSARAWMSLGFTAQQARCWIESGISAHNPSKVDTLRQIGITRPDDARPWLQLDHIEADDIVALRNAGVTGDDVRDLAAAGHDASSVRKILKEAARAKKLTAAELIEWGKVGTHASHAQGRAQFIKSGLTAADAAAWQKVLGGKITPERIRDAISSGITLGITDGWRDLHPNFADADRVNGWVSRGLTIADAEPWAAITATDTKCTQDFTDVNLVQRWIAAHPLLADPQRAAQAAATGVSPKHAGELLTLADSWNQPRSDAAT